MNRPVTKTQLPNGSWVESKPGPMLVGRPLLCRLRLHRWRHDYYDTPSHDAGIESPVSPFPMTYWRRGCTRCGAKAWPTV